MKKFETILITYDISSAWTFLTVSFYVEKEYGSKAVDLLSNRKKLK
jgi:hypothetical protein|tara:strand:+ start:437 stop:574 length:138 start_codon:yes stop_codon:yes gene_type:complete